MMRIDTKQIDTSVNEDDHRYFGFPYHLVFDASVYILQKMGMRISFSNLYQGRIIAARGDAKGDRHGHLDVKLIGRGSVTLVHVKAASGTVSSRDDTGRLRRRFLWELDEWLHKAKVEELAKVQDHVSKTHGKPTDVYVPPSTAYKLDPLDTHEKGYRPADLVWVSAVGPLGTAGCFHPGPPPG